MILLFVLFFLLGMVDAFPADQLEENFCDESNDVAILAEIDIGNRKRQADLADDDDEDDNMNRIQGNNNVRADFLTVFFQKANIDQDNDGDDDDSDLSGKSFVIRGAARLPRDTKLLVSLDDTFRVLGFDVSNDDTKKEYNLAAAGTICKKGLELAFKGSVALLLIMLMLGMGASTSIAEFKNILRKKRAPFLIGFASQYLFLPAFGLGLAFALGLPSGIAIGLVLVASSPGGTTSQLYTYLSNGDVALSLSMTFASTITSFAFIPLFSFLYLQPFLDANDANGVVIPFADIILALLLVIVPTGIGILIRAKASEGTAKFVEKAGAIAGVLGIMCAIGIGVVLFIDVFDQDINVYVAAVVLPTVGMAAGYFFGFVGRQKRKHCRTISFECGLQNTSVTITLVALAFDGVLQKEVLVIPLLYSLFVFVPAGILTLLYRYLSRFDPADQDSDDEDDGEEMSPKPKTSAAPVSVLTPPFTSESDSIGVSVYDAAPLPNEPVNDGEMDVQDGDMRALQEATLRHADEIAAANAELEESL